MQRCPRCRTSERTLIRFGVYSCPTCGETDPDGVPLAAAPVAGSPAAGSVFAAPPPPAWTPPGVAAPPREESGGPPTILVTAVVVMIVLDLIAAAGARNACSSIMHLAGIGFQVAVLSGRPWARTLGLFSALLEVLGAIFVLALATRVPEPQLAFFLRVIGAVSLVLTLGWIYVLMRADVTAYFLRNRR